MGDGYCIKVSVQKITNVSYSYELSLSNIILNVVFVQGGHTVYAAAAAEPSYSILYYFIDTTQLFLKFFLILQKQQC